MISNTRYAAAVDQWIHSLKEIAPNNLFVEKMYRLTVVANHSEMLRDDDI
jgi:hypothetical protein